MRALNLFAIFSLAACGAGDGVLNITVRVPSGLSAPVATLSFDISSATDTTQFMMFEGGITPPQSGAFESDTAIQFAPSHAGSIDISVTANSTANSPIADGFSEVMADASVVTPVMIDLTASAPACSASAPCGGGCCDSITKMCVSTGSTCASGAVCSSGTTC